MAPLLLCSLLLGNTAVNALVAILLADVASGVVGLIATTGLLVIFGEIVPQSLCSRYALSIGAKSIPLVCEDGIRTCAPCPLGAFIPFLLESGVE